ncbi:solute carrier organic anion transporter family member 5A1-like [Vespula squamosa]|uniref:Solute carrier organic anion transporter family member 5A1-like n=1 Tax=Vespula squamosa TaxID=30214 RepID=A0ABD2AW25_VESSQ
MRVLVFVVISNSIAFPQNGLNLDDVSRVDGFAFDGPVDRPFSSTQRPVINNMIDPITTTQATPVSVTPTSEVYENCITSCLVTPEYNPVCGTDNISYDNPGKLNCAIGCGKKITLNSYGRCSADGSRG